MVNKVDLTKHEVETIAVTCVDFRYRELLAELIGKMFGEADLIAMPGASKAVLETAAVVDAIGLLINLHHAKKVVVLDHIDCGAYGGSKKYDWDHPAEVSMHGQQLAEAKKLLQQKFPGVEVIVYLVGAEGVLGEISQ